MSEDVVLSLHGKILMELAFLADDYIENTRRFTEVGINKKEQN